jgi:hypothetical protein
MRLESARDLKNELLNDIVIPYGRWASARPAAQTRGVRIPVAACCVVEPAPLAVGATLLPRQTDIQRSVALGIARKGRNYRLAVRVQRQGLLDGKLVEHLKQEARGEVDIRFIGRLEKRAGVVPGDSDENDHAPRRGKKGTPARRMVFVGTQSIAEQWYCQNARPLLIGTSIGHHRVTAGTLGAFVQRGAKPFILSNNHVLANEDRGKRGDPVVQRATSDGGSDPADRVGTLRHVVQLRRGSANYVDAALSDIRDDIEYDPVRLREISKGTDGRLAGLGPDFVDEGEIVYKVGRTTGPTVGRVTAFDMDNVVVSYGVGNLLFNGQVEIEGADSRAFSDGGDSGALIVNGRMEAVALLFAGGDVGGSNGRGLTYAHPIHKVLQDLKAELLT